MVGWHCKFESSTLAIWIKVTVKRTKFTLFVLLTEYFDLKSTKTGIFVLLKLIGQRCRQ